MREEELRAYRNKAIEKDRRSIENRLNHAFNQGYEMGRQMAKPDWIPVETALPEEDGWYLVTVKNLTGYTLLERDVFECKYFGDWIFDGWQDNHVIAWMPLPTPPNKSEISTGAEGSDKE